MTLPDDTPLDFMAAQARAFPPLADDEIERRLTGLRADPTAGDAEILVEHHLAIALDAAVAHADKGVEVADLYQEGTFAIFVAVTEYATRGGPASGLRAYVEKLVERHLETAITDATAEREADLAMVRAAEELDRTEIRLRHEFERQPTDAELAAAMEWPLSQVHLVQTMLRQAREMWDEDITQYLDDDESDGENEE